MGKGRHPIYSNSGDAKCGTQPENGINIARHCVHGYSITAAPANSVTHVSFRWCVYVTTFRAQSTGDKYAMWPVAWGMESTEFSRIPYEVPSELSEPSGTHSCF